MGEHEFLELPQWAMAIALRLSENPPRLVIVIPQDASPPEVWGMVDVIRETMGVGWNTEVTLRME